MRLASWLLAALVLLPGLDLPSLRAQPKAAKAAPPSDRCLLIVETSKPMQRRSDAVLGAVRGLLTSGLNGQFRDGSTLGVWTYNEELYAGRFPLQTWSSSAQKDITQRALAFLKGQKYEKQANFHKVAPALGRVIDDSKVITVVLISSGDHEVRGTPFDDQINAAYRRWSSQQQKARMPFVTVLFARNGQIANYIVNTPPWPLEMPRLPPEPKSAEVVQEKFVEAVRKGQTSSVPPLIISGRKPPAEQAPTPKPEPAIAKPEAQLPVAAVVASNEPAMVTPPGPTAPPVEIAKTEPAPVVPARPATEVAPRPTSTPVEVTEAKPGDVKAQEAKPGESASATPAATPAVLVPAPKPEPAAFEPTKPPAVPEVETHLKPVTAVTQGVPSAAVPSATVAQPATSGAASLAPPPLSRPAPRAQSATVTPAGSLVRSRNIWLGGTLLALGVLGIAFRLMRRARTAPQGSLITRSFDREKEP